MEQTHLAWITDFIWRIADNLFRDLYVQGKFRDVILPMNVPRRPVRSVLVQYCLRNPVGEVFPETATYAHARRSPYRRPSTGEEGRRVFGSDS